MSYRSTLPRMNNLQFEEVDTRFRRGLHKGKCPTCGSKPEEIAPGIYDWGMGSYKMEGESIECDCRQQIDLYLHYLLANIPEEYMRLTEEDYFGDWEAWKDTTEFIEKWECYKTRGLGIGLHSKVQGTGKTFLATRVARALVQRGESVYYTDFRDIVGLWSLPYDIRSEKEKRLNDSTLLVLDEIAKPVSGAQQDHFGSHLESLIRHRTNYGMATIMTTNLEPDELDEFYPRTFSLLEAKQKHITIKKTTDARREGIWDINTYLAENGERRPIT